MNVDEQLHCTICLNLPEREAYQCLNGHLFCSACAERLQNQRTATCPSCHIKIEPSLSRNRLAEHLIADLKAKEKSTEEFTGNDVIRNFVGTDNQRYYDEVLQRNEIMRRWSEDFVRMIANSDYTHDNEERKELIDENQRRDELILLPQQESTKERRKTQQNEARTRQEPTVQSAPSVHYKSIEKTNEGQEASQTTVRGKNVKRSDIPPRGRRIYNRGQLMLLRDSPHARVSDSTMRAILDAQIWIKTPPTDQLMNEKEQTRQEAEEHWRREVKEQERRWKENERQRQEKEREKREEEAKKQELENNKRSVTELIRRRQEEERKKKEEAQEQGGLGVLPALGVAGGIGILAGLYLLHKQEEKKRKEESSTAFIVFAVLFGILILIAAFLLS